MMTVLTVHPDEVSQGRVKYLAKQITQTPTGYDVRAYDTAMFFNADTFPTECFDGLVTVLSVLEDMPHSCVIRGELIPGKPDVRVRRKKDDPDPDLIFFRENLEGVQWIMMDFDSVPTPAGMTDPADWLEYLVSLLPPEFATASYYYQWSSTAGLKGWSVLKAHLWFWLDEPWTDTFLKAKAVGEGWPVDAQPFTTVQPNYTAAPVFTNCADPIPRRSGVVRKASDTVALTPWVPPVIDQSAYLGLPTQTPSQRFNELLDAIGHPHLHGATLLAAAHYIRVNGAACDTAKLERIISDRIWQSPRSASDKRRADRDLKRQISTAVRKYGVK